MVVHEGKGDSDEGEYDRDKSAHCAAVDFTMAYFSVFDSGGVENIISHHK